jgi:hypothetical protein
MMGGNRVKVGRGGGSALVVDQLFAALAYIPISSSLGSKPPHTPYTSSPHLTILSRSSTSPDAQARGPSSAHSASDYSSLDILRIPHPRLLFLRVLASPSFRLTAPGRR